jgi:O-antigen/teichoic acid export membrane protein
LKNTLHKIYNKVGIKSDRTKNITKHVLLSFVYKGGSILASFLLVPLTINYLDTENYGIWLTLSSFIAWFSFFDIGLGNGLRNKFAEAKAKGEMTLARGYVSSAYFTIGAVSIGLIVIFTALNFFIDWTKVFNTSPNLQKDLSLLMPIVFGFFCLQLVVKLITTIYTADQHHSMQGKINFFTQIGSLLLIWIMTKTSESSLLVFGVIFSALPVVILLWFNLFAFNKRYIDFKPSIKLWKKEYLKGIFGLGFSFFILQMAWIIITSTDNFIISQLFSPKEVVPYFLALKLFPASTMFFTIIVTPYWSTFTEAYVKKDFNWIKKSMKQLEKFTLLFSILCAILLLFSNYLYRLWVGDEIEVSFILSALVCIYTIMIIILTPFNYFINGTGKIKMQLIQTTLMAIVNIPISIFFAINLNFGINGIIIGTIICVIPGVVLSRIQYNKLINKKALGIWNK